MHAVQVGQPERATKIYFQIKNRKGHNDCPSSFTNIKFIVLLLFNIRIKTIKNSMHYGVKNGKKFFLEGEIHDIGVEKTANKLNTEMISLFYFVEQLRSYCMYHPNVGTQCIDK